MQGLEPVSVGNVDILFIIDFFGINFDFKKYYILHIICLCIGQLRLHNKMPWARWLKQ